jgi:hypothetical protein
MTTTYDWGYLNSATPVASDGNVIKDRMLVNFSDNSYGPNGSSNSPLELAAQEASRIMDIFLKPYVTVPFTTFPLDAILQMICADFAANVFKRRQYPSEQSMKAPLQPDMINDVEGSGWFAVGLKRLQDYIKTVYALGVTVPSSVSNPAVYAQLYKDGMITLKEFRSYASDPNGTITQRLQEIKTMDHTLNDLINRDLTEATYKYSKKKSFVFISSDSDGGYQLDSEAY